MTLTDGDQQRRREWFRSHWQTGVAFNLATGITVSRWDPDGVELLLPYRDDLTAHDGIFHGGVIAALVDTAGCGAVAAGHNFDHGSRISTTMLSLQYLAAVPRESVVAHAACTKRGRHTQYAEVAVRTVSGVAVAHGLVTVNTGGERPGLSQRVEEVN
jgi:uncharacterized protein (TIGR00369 family)